MTSVYVEVGLALLRLRAMERKLLSGEPISGTSMGIARSHLERALRALDVKREDAA